MQSGEQDGAVIWILASPKVSCPNGNHKLQWKIKMRLWERWAWLACVMSIRIVEDLGILKQELELCYEKKIDTNTSIIESCIKDNCSCYSRTNLCYTPVFIKETASGPPYKQKLLVTTFFVFWCSIFRDRYRQLGQILRLSFYFSESKIPDKAKQAARAPTTWAATHTTLLVSYCFYCVPEFTIRSGSWADFSMEISVPCP